LLISVVMPIRNGEPHLATQLAALADQRCRIAWELIAVDNGCTDRSIEIVESWRSRLPAVTVVDARYRRGLNHPRNAWAAAAHGDFLAFCDADDVVTPDWLERLAEQAPSAHLVGGYLEVAGLNDETRQAWQPSSPMTGLNSDYEFLAYPSGGNCAIWTHVAREVRWDESFRFGASDIDFAWRAQLAGFRATFAPQAVVQVRYRSQLASLARQYFSYGASEPHLFRCFRGQGMPAQPIRDAYETWRWLARKAPQMVRGRDVRGNWLRVAAGCCGRLWGSLRWRVVYL
jgi:glycosyltransferase involved in cell wall biosynthesis